MLHVCCTCLNRKISRHHLEQMTDFIIYASGKKYTQSDVFLSNRKWRNETSLTLLASSALFFLHATTGPICTFPSLVACTIDSFHWTPYGCLCVIMFRWTNENKSEVWRSIIFHKISSEGTCTGYMYSWE